MPSAALDRIPAADRAPLARPPADPAPPRHLHAVPEAAPQAAPGAAPEAPHAPDAPPEPDPRAVQRLALLVFEAIEGSRALAQLGGWVAQEALDELALRRSARMERRSIARDRRRVISRPGPAHLDRPRRGVIEATVVLHAVPRATAVALRLELLGGRWRATRVAVL